MLEISHGQPIAPLPSRRHCTIHVNFQASIDHKCRPVYIIHDSLKIRNLSQELFQIPRKKS